MNNIKLIRVKQKVGSGVRVFAYVLVNVRTKKHGYSETISVDVTPIIKDELLSGVPEEDLSKTTPLDDKTNRFIATADANRETVTIAAGPRMMLGSSIRNKGVGTFALNEIIRWMIVKYPNYMLDVINISSSFLPDKDDRKRSVHFFSNFGFNFKESGSEYEGTMEAVLCMNLHEYLNRGKIDEIDISKFIRELLRERYMIEETIKNQGRLIQEHEVFRHKAEKDKFTSVLINILIVMSALFLLFYLR
ncbi:hypothetical protein ADMFC3_08220 [Geovibrio sp. ADMFC3]|jgi:hypothetical protein